MLNLAQLNPVCMCDTGSPLSQSDAVLWGCPVQLRYVYLWLTMYTGPACIFVALLGIFMALPVCIGDTGSPVSQSDAVLLGYPLQMPMSQELRLNDLNHYERVSRQPVS